GQELTVGVGRGAQWTPPVRSALYHAVDYEDRGYGRASRGDSPRGKGAQNGTAGVRRLQRFHRVYIPTLARPSSRPGRFVTLFRGDLSRVAWRPPVRSRRPAPRSGDPAHG